MSIKLNLFGPPRLIIDNETKLLNGTNTAVISLLALSPATQFQLSRSRIAGTIWPDSHEEHARQLLSNTLYRLRKLLPDGILLTDSDILQLQNIEIDIVQFQTLLQSGNIDQLEQAIQLYTGDLLEGHDPLWALPHRVERREQYLNCLSQTAASFEEMGQLNKALLMANKWALADPLNELAHTAVMNLCVKLGRFGIAIQQYETLTQLLDEELGVAPLPETQQLYNLILNERQQSSSTGTTAPSIPFIGRNEERRQLLLHLDRLKDHGHVIFIEGDPGIGKTRLLTEISKSAEWRNVRIGWGKQAENQAQTDYAPLPQAIHELATPTWLEKVAPQLTQNNKKSLAPWLPKLQAYLPSFEIGAPSTELRKTIPIQFAVQKLLRALSENTPTLIILDDLHWADDKLWGILPKILPTCRERPLLFLLSFRSQEIRQNKQAWQAIRKIERELNPIHLKLHGLHPNECQTFASYVSDPISLEKATELVQRCDGNPLFLKELILSNQTHSDAFEQSMKNRLSLLEQQETTALSAAAVLGREFRFNVWQRCVEHPIHLTKLIQSRFLIETTKGLAFEHDLIRAHIYNNLSPNELRFWHQQVGAALPETNHQLAKIAWHFEQAEAWAQATHYYQKAAVFALQIEDQAGADRYCALAIKLEAQSNIDEKLAMALQLLQLELKHSSLWTESEYQHFSQLADSVTAMHDSNLKRRYLLLKSNALLSQGKLESIEKLFDEIITLTPEHLDLIEKINTYNKMSYLLGAFIRNTERGIELSQQAITWAKALPQHPHLLVNSIFILTLNYLYRRDLESVLDNLVWAESLIDKYPELAPMRSELLFYQAVWAQLTGEWEQARTKQHKLIEFHRQSQQVNELLSALFNATNIAVFTCQFEEGAMLAEELLAASEEFMVEMDAFYTHIYRSIAIEAFSITSQFEKANAIAKQVLEWLETAENGQHKIQGLTAVAMLRFDEGRYEDAYQTAIQMLESIEQNDSSTTRSFVFLAELAYLTGRLDEAMTFITKARAKFKPGVVSPSIFHYHYVNYLIDQDISHLSIAYEVILLCAKRFNSVSLRWDFISRGSCQKDIYKAMAKHSAFKKVALAKRDAPKGKPLSERDKIFVWWTLDDGTADAKFLSEHGKIALRHHRLKRLVSQAEIQGAIATHADLAQALNVTVRTIERDSKQLLQQGISLTTRGAVKQVA
ncbi:MAG: AAA family ATPase [Chloroflexota bacterium]